MPQTCYDLTKAMNPNRTIPTVTKPSKHNPYNGSLPQPKLKILTCAGPIIRPAAAATSTTAATSSTKALSANNTQSQHPPGSAALINNNITTRLPPKPSGLVRPTPVRHIISAASTTSSLKRPTTLLPSSTTSSLKQPSQQPSSTTSAQRGSKLAALGIQSSIKTALVKKQTALNSHLPTSTANNALNQLQFSNLKDSSIIESVTGEVGEIRRLLEQLLQLLQSSQEQHDNLAIENERLRKELTEIRGAHTKVEGTQPSVTLEDTEAQRIKDDRPSVYYSPLK